MRQQRKHSLSCSTLPSAFSVAFARIVSGFGENFLTASAFQPVQFSIFTLYKFVTSGIVVAAFIAQISHHHWSKTASGTADDCYDVFIHLCTVWAQVLLCCQLFLTHGERRITSRMSFGNWSPVRSQCRCSRFSQDWMACERSPFWVTVGGDKICLLSSKLPPAAKGSYKAASLRHCSKPGSQSAPRNNFQSFSFRP